MAKAIIDVEINEGEWIAFQRQVDAHRKKLTEMPHQWGAVGKAIVKASGDAAKLVARMEAQNAAWKNANTLAGKFNLTLKAADRTLTTMGRSAANFGKHIKEATRSVLSWVPVFGVISGLMGAGGLFGLSRLAASVSQGSMTAMGAGSSYGATKAAGISYGPAMGGDVTGLLNRIAEEQRSGGIMFRRLGLPEAQWKGRESADVLGPLLAAIQRKYKEGPEATAKQRMEAFAPGMDFNTILRVSKLNVEGLEKEYQSRKRLLDLSQGTQDSWGRFHRALESAADLLENMFARALGGNLLKAITDFTGGLLRATNMLMNSPIAKKLISGAGFALESGAQYLTSDEFPKDIKKFVDTMGEIRDAMVVVAQSLYSLMGGYDKRAAKIELNSAEADRARLNAIAGTVGPSTPSRQAIAASNAAALNTRIENKIDMYVSNSSGGNIIAQAKGVSSSTYRK